MELSELKRYLKTVCDGENSKYMLSESIKQMQTTRQRLLKNLPNAPVKPDLSTTKIDSTDGFGCAFGVLLAIIGGIMGFNNSTGFFNKIGGFLGYGFIGLLIGTFSSMPILSRMDSKKREAQYEQDVYEYKSKAKIYIIEGNARENTLNIIDSNIVTAQNKLAEINSLLNTLYAQNIIYSSFRNQVAVNQIYEYLMMGICDTLEGPNGAYAQYMNDVRAARICDSIDNLRVAMEQGMASILSLQTQLVSLVKETNSLLSTIHYSIESGFNSVCQEIRSSASTQSNIDRKLDEMNRNLQTATYNQYIAASHTNMKQYLRMP